MRFFMLLPLRRIRSIGTFCFLIVTTLAFGQHRLLHYSPKDQAIFKNLTKDLNRTQVPSTGEGMILAGRALLGTLCCANP